VAEVRRDALNKVLTRDFVVRIYQAVSIERSLCKQTSKNHCGYRQHG